MTPSKKYTFVANQFNCASSDNTLHNPSKMQLSSLRTLAVALFASSVSATALTYKLAPNEKACFFSSVAEKQAKIAFYFAVSLSWLHRGYPQMLMK